MTQPTCAKRCRLADDPFPPSTPSTGPPVLIETLRRPAGKQPTDKAQTFASRLLIQRMGLFSVKPWETQKKQQVTSSDEMGALTAHWNRNVPPQLAEKFDPIWKWKKTSNDQWPVSCEAPSALRNQRSYQRADTCRAKELSLGWSRGPAQAKHIGPQVASMGAGRPRISRDRSTTNKINMWVSELQDTPIHCTVHRENHHDQPENFGSDLSTFHVHTSPCKGAQTHGVAVADLAALGKWRSVVVRSRSCCWSSCNSQCYSMYWLVEARWIPYICWWVRKKLDPKFLWTPILHGRLPPRNSTVCSWKLPLSSLIYPWKMVIFQFASS